MTENYKSLVEEVTTYRNFQDLINHERDKAIIYAKGIARSDVLGTVDEPPSLSLPHLTTCHL
jgi:hypothetical protein